MISDKIEAIKAAVNEQLAKSEHLQDVQDIRVKFLGKKGELTAIMKEMKNFSKEERPKVGQLVNTARNAIEDSAPDGRLVPAHGLLHRRRDGYRIGLL